jgi:hypothetical protein
MRFLSLAGTVIAVFLVSLGPFALMGQIPQLLNRLFPFTRGLNHAYWAPNAWSLVTATDRVLLKGDEICAYEEAVRLTANLQLHHDWVSPWRKTHRELLQPLVALSGTPYSRFCQIFNRYTLSSSQFCSSLYVLLNHFIASRKVYR